MMQSGDNPKMFLLEVGMPFVTVVEDGQFGCRESESKRGKVLTMSLASSLPLLWLASA